MQKKRSFMLKKLLRENKNINYLLWKDASMLSTKRTFNYARIMGESERKII